MATEAGVIPRPRLGFLASVCRGADDVGDAGKCCSSSALGVSTSVDRISFNLLLLS